MKSTQPADGAFTVLYQLRSVAPVAAPPDGEGTWFRYVIVQGDNEITGLRTGSAGEVEVAVRTMVDRLNERSKGKNAPITKQIKTAVADSVSSSEQSQS